MQQKGIVVESEDVVAAPLKFIKTLSMPAIEKVQITKSV
jgi:hypothetical protein